jgi:PGF-pre-PGF domain-containing protein
MRSRKNFLLIILIFIFLIAISITASAKEITVDDDSGADFRLIQEAVNNSIQGDTIIVMPGAYTENILVNVAGLTIRSESENSDVHVRALNESESVFLIRADNVTISGFNLTGAVKGSPNYRGGIRLENVTNCIITDNIFFENEIGLFFNRASHNTISDNFFFNNEIILDEESNMNNLTGNTIDRGYVSLGAWSSGNLIAENEISNGAGIDFACCGANNVVSGNRITNCSGISSYDQGVEIDKNRITDCYCGISLSQSPGKISNNTIVNCSIGISLDYYLVEISNNTITASRECGIYLQDSAVDELIYNNYFNNTINIKLETYGGNTWNDTLTSGSNIAGGPYIGGNFWAKPDGTGFSQICADLDGNGIGDLPYHVYEDPYNTHEDKFDYLPLVSTSSPQNYVTPTANFTASITNGTAPLTVKFTDLSNNAVAWNWDFDGDSISDSTKQNPVYVYKTSGYYTVNLTASNGRDKDLKSLKITVQTAKVLPVADPKANITRGRAPLTVQFADHSQNITSRSWDFNNDGITDSSDVNPVYTYATAGNYTVNLKVSNENGTASKNLSIFVRDASGEDYVLPIANFTTNITSGYAPLYVRFTDLSSNATSWSWDFDNNGYQESFIRNTVYVFKDPGTYTVELTAINENGTNSKLATINVVQRVENNSVNKGSMDNNTTSGNIDTEENEANENIGGISHSSSLSSGGAGGSPELQSNVQVKEISQTFIASGKSVKFDFPKNSTPVVYVSFDSKKTAGKTTAIAEMLKGKSTLVSGLPSAEVYKFLNIWVGNSGFATPTNIENAIVNFKVEKSWIQDKRIEQSSITLNRYNDKKWDQLPTSLLSEDNKYLYFTARTLGFSPFAITGKVVAKQAVTETQPKSNMQGLEQNNVSTADVKHEPEQNESTNMPGFEVAYSIICLLGVFLYKAR